MADLRVQVVHSVKEIGQETWDRLGQGRPFTGYRWYRYGEAVLADDVPVYILLSQGSEPLACGTFWLRGQEALPVESRMVRRIVEVMLRRWPALMCQSPIAGAAGLILPDPPLRDVALELSSDPPLLQQGVVLQTGEGRVEFNNQVATRLIRYQSEIRRIIHRVVFDSGTGS